MTTAFLKTTSDIAQQQHPSKKRVKLSEEKYISTDSEDDDDDEDDDESPEDLRRANEILVRALLLVRRLEKKYGQEADDIKKRTEEARERMTKAAIAAWFSRSFPRLRTPSLATTTTSERDVSRNQFRDFMNAYLERLGLPQLGKRSPLWTRWVLPNLIGIPEDERRNGRQITLWDNRSLENFESTLQDLLRIVHQERQESEGFIQQQRK